MSNLSSIAAKAQWADPVRRAARIANMKRAHNKIETLKRHRAAGLALIDSCPAERSYTRRQYLVFVYHENLAGKLETQHTSVEP